MYPMSSPHGAIWSSPVRVRRVAHAGPSPYANPGPGAVAANGYYTAPVPPTEKPFSFQTKEELLSQDPLAANVLAVVDNQAQKNKLAELASTGTQAGDEAISAFSHGIQASKFLVEQRKTEVDSDIRDLEIQLSDRRREKELLKAIETDTILVAEKLETELQLVKQGKRPETLTQEFLISRCHKMGLKVADDPHLYIAKLAFLEDSDDIQALLKDECVAVVRFLSHERFHRNKGYFENIAYYKALGVIGRDFLEDCVYGKGRDSHDTLRGLIGIYFRMLPENAQNYVFTRRQEHEGLPCWTEKSAANAGVSVNGGAVSQGDGVGGGDASGGGANVGAHQNAGGFFFGGAANGVAAGGGGFTFGTPVQQDCPFNSLDTKLPANSPGMDLDL